MACARLKEERWLYQDNYKEAANDAIKYFEITSIIS